MVYVWTSEMLNMQLIITLGLVERKPRTSGIYRRVSLSHDECVGPLDFIVC